MDNKANGPAALIFPLPVELKDQYIKWSQSLQQPSTDGEITRKLQEAGCEDPVMIPVYAPPQGYIPCLPCCLSPPGCPCKQEPASKSPITNPFILFLIFILLLLAFKKDQIIETLRKLITKNRQIPGQG